MTQFSERHVRLVKKEQELEKLFEEAANRRKKLLQQKYGENFVISSDLQKKDNYILKPLRSSENLLATDSNDNKIEISFRHICMKLNRHSAYYSNHDLPETNLDFEDISLQKSNNNSNHVNTINSNENLNRPGLLNTSFVTYSSSSDEVDITNYCQFIPTTSLSTNNNTSSSHYSRTDNSTSKMSSLGQSSSERGTQSSKDIDDNTHLVKDIADNAHSVEYIHNNSHSENSHTKQMSKENFYPSGSSLISHKYQGSPVVWIDDKLRAGEANYLINRRKPSLLKKSPLTSRNLKLPQKHVPCLATAETRLSHPVLIDIDESNNDPSSPISFDNPMNMSTSIIRRTKKKLLEEHMRKRLSVGDYSTRALIEWENNLNSATLEQLSMSGDLPTRNDSDKLIKRKLCSQSDAALFPIYHNDDIIASSHNFSSEVNILHCNSTDSIRDTQVSFSVKNDDMHYDYKSRNSEKVSKHTNFIQRSMNDIAAALKNVTTSEKVSNSKRFLFSNRGHFIGHGLFKKRDSTSSDLLYSVPPFARKHMPPDISGASRIISQGTYQSNNLPSSSPNLIAELDPTFHERYPLELLHNDISNSRQRLSKRNRSYRLSFIENAHTVTTKKLTATNSTTSSANASVLRFVQPRRRMVSHNSAKIKRQDSPKWEPRNARSRSSNRRFSCAQQ